MATKIQQILEAAPNESVLFGSWLSSQGLDARGQYAYMKSGWLDRISKGVYKIHGTEPSLFAAVSSYNTQLSKSCVVGAYLYSFGTPRILPLPVNGKTYGLSIYRQKQLVTFVVAKRRVGYDY